MLARVTNARLSAFTVLLLLIFIVAGSLVSAQVKRKPARNQRQKESREQRERREKNEQEEKEEKEEREGKYRQFDDPAEEEELNRELWEFARGTSYQQILPYVAEEQRKSRANQIAEVELPTGWRIAPA